VTRLCALPLGLCSAETALRAALFALKLAALAVASALARTDEDPAQQRYNDLPSEQQRIIAAAMITAKTPT
jgi:hypothetical protein